MNQSSVNPQSAIGSALRPSLRASLCRRSHFRSGRRKAEGDETHKHEAKSGRVDARHLVTAGAVRRRGRAAPSSTQAPPQPQKRSTHRRRRGGSRRGASRRPQGRCDRGRSRGRHGVPRPTPPKQAAPPAPLREAAGGPDGKDKAWVAFRAVVFRELCHLPARLRLQPNGVWSPAQSPKGIPSNFGSRANFARASGLTLARITVAWPPSTATTISFRLRPASLT
jgi:hypothetical protein